MFRRALKRFVYICAAETLLAGHSARAANWQVVASPNAGKQANSLVFGRSRGG